MKTYYIRQSEYIQEDLKRGWSSWNFGQEGISCTEEEFEDLIENLKQGEIEYIDISGFQIYADHLKNTRFGELQKNYWVVVDEENCWGGLACCKFEAENDEQAKQIVEKEKENLIDLEGIGKNLSEMRFVFTIGDLHVFTEEE